MKGKVGMKLIRKKLGFRYLMDVIPLDAALVRGSHGVHTEREHGPLLMTRQTELLEGDAIQPTDVHDLILAHLWDG